MTESGWILKMASLNIQDGLIWKSVQHRIVRLVEAHKFHIWAVLIGGHMQARRPAQGGRQRLGQIQTESELE